MKLGGRDIQRERLRETIAWVHQGDEVGIVLDDDEAIPHDRQARCGAHVRAPVQRGIGALAERTPEPARREPSDGEPL